MLDQRNFFEPQHKLSHLNDGVLPELRLTRMCSFADRLDTKYYAPFVPVYNFQIRRLANDAKVSVQLGQNFLSAAASELFVDDERRKQRSTEPFLISVRHSVDDSSQTTLVIGCAPPVKLSPLNSGREKWRHRIEVAAQC